MRNRVCVRVCACEWVSVCARVCERGAEDLPPSLPEPSFLLHFKLTLLCYRLQYVAV